MHALPLACRNNKFIQVDDCKTQRRQQAHICWGRD
jgi:hypothetical protein